MLEDSQGEKGENGQEEKKILIDFGGASDHEDEKGNSQTDSSENKDFLEIWNSEENKAQRKKDYLLKRIDLSIEKYLSSKTLDEYVKRIGEMDGTAAQSEAEIWKSEIRKQLRDRFENSSSFDKEAASEVIKLYIQDNVPLLAGVVEDIKTKETSSLQEDPRSTYEKYLNNFIEAYFSDQLLRMVSFVRKVDESSIYQRFETGKQEFKEKLLQEFDVTSSNIFDAEKVYEESEYFLSRKMF